MGEWWSFWTNFLQTASAITRIIDGLFNYHSYSLGFWEVLCCCFSNVERLNHKKNKMDSSSCLDSFVCIHINNLCWKDATLQRRSIHVTLNCKYHPWGLINAMQMSIYNRKHWHALSHLLYFARHEGDWRPTHPPQRVSRVPDYLYSFQSVLGLSQVSLIPP